MLSAVLGYAVPSILPREYTHYASAILFLFFGYKLLKDGYESEGGASHELQEVEEELEAKKDDPIASALSPSETEDDPESVLGLPVERSPSTAMNGGTSPIKTILSRVEAWTKATLLAYHVPPVFVQTFTMTFLAEWGDRSQISTIALASAKDPYGVTAGGTVGHAICTGIAVVGGRLLASRISEKSVNIAGGALFLLFAIYSFVVGPNA